MRSIQFWCDTFRHKTDSTRRTIESGKLIYGRAFPEQGTSANVDLADVVRQPVKYDRRHRWDPAVLKLRALTIIDSQTCRKCC